MIVNIQFNTCEPKDADALGKLFATAPVACAAPCSTEATPAEPVVDKREADKAKLTKALSGSKYKWRNLDTLTTRIFGGDADDASEVYVKELLGEIGARTDFYADYLYGLTSRVGESGRRSYR